MIRKRILSLLVCAALLCGVLAGCSTSSGSTAEIGRASCRERV